MSAAALDLVHESALDREFVRRRGLREFVRIAWPLVDTTPFVEGWHIDAICEHLEAVTRGEIRDLVINIPPGLGKSLLVSVLWPAWTWTLDPAHRWLAISYDEKLVLRDARRHRTLVASDWFQARWPEVRLPPARDASASVGLWYTSAKGMRFSTTVRGAVTGQHGDTAVVDDPIDPRGAGAASGLELDEVLRFWRETLPNRFRVPEKGARVCVMQRLHERDLAGEMIRSGAAVLCLPMRHERHHPNRWAGDPRVEEGELLAPERYPAATVAHLQKTMGPSADAAQNQQRPSPEGGGVFKKPWLQHYWITLPPGGSWTLTWDCTFKDTKTSHFVAGQAWYQVGAKFYLVDRVLERMDFDATCKGIVVMSGRFPRALKKLVEGKANGPAIISALKRDVVGLIEIEPEGGKVARAYATEPLFAAGDVLMPHPDLAEMPDGSRGAPWLRGGMPLHLEASTDSYEHAMLGFPNAAQDDDVDATTQFLNHAAPRTTEKFKRGWGRVADEMKRGPT